MTNKLQALTDLRDKVKAGTCVIPDDVHESPLPFSVERYIVDAYNGSLDAAKALPGWGYEICNGAEVTLRQYSKKIIFKNVCPARAWLLAILEALIAQEGTDHE